MSRRKDTLPDADLAKLPPAQQFLTAYHGDEGSKAFDSTHTFTNEAIVFGFKPKATPELRAQAEKYLYDFMAYSVRSKDGTLLRTLAAAVEPYTPKPAADLLAMQLLSAKVKQAAGPGPLPDPKAIAKETGTHLKTVQSRAKKLDVKIAEGKAGAPKGTAPRPGKRKAQHRAAR